MNVRCPCRVTQCPPVGLRPGERGRIPRPARERMRSSGYCPRSFGTNAPAAHGSGPADGADAGTRAEAGTWAGVARTGGMAPARPPAGPPAGPPAPPLVQRPPASRVSSLTRSLARRCVLGSTYGAGTVTALASSALIRASRPEPLLRQVSPGGARMPLVTWATACATVEAKTSPRDHGSPDPIPGSTRFAMLHRASPVHPPEGRRGHVTANVTGVSRAARPGLPGIPHLSGRCRKPEYPARKGVLDSPARGSA